MSGIVKRIDAQVYWQAVRFVVNGSAAAIVHFSVLSINLFVLNIRSAGVANFIAATAGIAASFLGSRYYVFRAQRDPLFEQLSRFGLLYACVALLHTAVLWAWTDVNHLDYRIGFLLATILQMILSFLGNKFLVFK